jgi:hypothetical protein
MQFATGDVTQLLSVTFDQGSHILRTDAAVNGAFCDNKFAKANSFGLKKSISTDLVALIV